VNPTPRVPLPYLMQRGRAEVLRCPVFSGAAQVAPTLTGSTCEVRDANGAVVSSGPIALDGATAVYTTGTHAGVSLGDRWLVVWTLIIGGVTYTFRQPAALVLCAPAPVVSDLDLFAQQSSLDPQQPGALSRNTTWQPKIDEAWMQIQRRLLQANRRPWLLVEQAELREPHIYLTLALIFRDFASRLNPAHLEMATQYQRMYEDMWSGLSMRYDTDESGTVPAGRTAAVPPIFLTGVR